LGALVFATFVLRRLPVFFVDVCSGDVCVALLGVVLLIVVQGNPLNANCGAIIPKIACTFNLHDYESIHGIGSRFYASL
jgi:hypothetical protein